MLNPELLHIRAGSFTLEGFLHPVVFVTLTHELIYFRAINGIDFRMTSGWMRNGRFLRCMGISNIL
jgi:hypothetical protein